MALRVLLLRKKLTDQQTALRALEQAAEGFSAREEELAADIEAAQTEEERSVVEDAVNAFEEERAQNTREQNELRSAIGALEEEIRTAEDAAKQARQGKPGGERRKDVTHMETNETRTRFFGLTIQQRDTFLAREDVSGFLSRLREMRGQTRSVSGAELGIPTVMLDLLRENIGRYSKLIGRVRFRPLKGKARQNIAGTVPAAVWTEAVDSLNELELSFTQVEMDGYKVGGYLAIPNSTLEDDDNLALASDVMDMMGQALGKGIDWAIVFGTGSKMPVGYMTRLAVQEAPAWWGKNQGAFTDLHTSNIIKLDASASSGVEFFQKLIAALAVADPTYSQSGEPTWVMNRKTHMDVLAKAMAFNASGALVAGMQNTMPVIGGLIVELPGLPDYQISGGYLDVYSLVERAGANIRSSDIPLMIQDQTLFTATQRMDGKPAVGEAFVAVSYDNQAVITDHDFAPDYANSELGTLTVVSAAGSGKGKTKLTVTGAASGSVLKVKTGAQPTLVKPGQTPGSTWAAYKSGTDLTAATGSYATVVELDAAGKVVKAGSVVVASAP